jgi:putative transposase
MPRGLQRLQESRQSHFVTFSCYHRQANFDSPEVYDLFLRGLEQMRQRFAMCIYGYVVMPEHVHLLVSEPGRASAPPVRAHSFEANLESSVPQVRGRSLAANLGSLAHALHYLKLSFTKQLHRETGFVGSFWQKRYYDRNVRDEREFVEKLRYLHRNPVKRGLVKAAADWKWSSFRHYTAGSWDGRD